MDQAQQQQTNNEQLQDSEQQEDKDEKDFMQQLSNSMFLKLKNIEGKYKKHKPQLKRYRSLQEDELKSGFKGNQQQQQQQEEEEEPAEINLTKEEEKQEIAENKKIDEVEENQSDQVGSEQMDKMSGTFYPSVKFGKVLNQAPARLSQPKIGVTPTKSILRSFDENKKPGYLKKLENIHEKRYSLNMKIQADSHPESHQKKAISKFGQSQKQQMSAKEFSEIWEKNKNFEQNRLEFLESIRGEDLNDIFTEGISCSIMLDLWKLFASKFQDNEELCLDFIESFFNVKQFDVNMKALISSEKQFISDFLNTLYQNKHIDEDLFTIYKKYF